MPYYNTYSTVLAASLDRTGYDFGGWYTVSDFASNTKITLDDPCILEQNFDAHAKWTAHTWTVSFNSHADNVDNPQSVTATYDQYYTFLPTLSREGYIFDGWYRNYNATTGEYSDKVETTDQCHTDANETLHAKWTPLQYTLTFNANTTDAVTWGDCFNNPTSSATVDEKETRSFLRVYASPMTLFNSCMDNNSAMGRPGYRLVGWSTQATGGNVVSYNSNIIDWTTGSNPNDVTLYAQWEVAPSCHLHPNGGTFTQTCISQCGLEGDVNSGDYKFWLTSGNPINTCSGLQATGNDASSYITQTGYHLVGWYADAEFNTPFDFSSTFSGTEDLDAYAKWDPNPHTLTFYAHGNNADPASFSLNNEDTVKARINYNAKYSTAERNGVAGWSSHFGVQRPGYYFVGWYADLVSDIDNPDGAIPSGAIASDAIFSNDNDNTKLYAGWKVQNFTVTYIANPGSITGGTVVGDATNTVTYNNAYGSLSSATRSGYDFAGWYLDEACTASPINAGSTVRTPGNHNLYAKWTKHTYTITFHANGTQTSPATISGKDTVKAQVVYLDDYNTAKRSNEAGWSTHFGASRTGYDFAGWYPTEIDAAEKTNEVIGSAAYTATEDTQLWAGWTAKPYTLTFDANGTTASPAYFDDRTTANGTKETTIYYDAQYQTAKYNNVEGWKNFGVFRPGYTFADWYDTKANADAAGTTGVVSATGTFHTAGNTETLYAGWAPKSYTLTLHAEGNADYSYTTYPAGFGTATGDEAKTVNNITYDWKYSQIPEWKEFDVKRTGFHLVDWNTKADGTGTTIAANRVFHDGDTASTFALYAQWEPNEYTVTFNTNQPGSTTPQVTPTSKTVTFASAYGELPTPTCTGYTFGGWFKEPACTNEVTANTVYDPSNPGNHSLYAKWTARQVDVTFNGNGGTPATQQQTYTFDQRYNTLPTVTKPGYSFGWYNGTTQITADSKCDQPNISWPADETQPGTLTLTAQWLPKQYQLTLKSNGGAFSTSPTKTHTVYITYDQPYSSLSGWEQLGLNNRTGYTFAGWYTDATSGERRQGNRTFTGDDTLSRTLYAHWTPKTYTCTLQDFRTADDSHNATINCAALANNDSFTAYYDRTFNASLGCNLNTDVYCNGFTLKWQRKYRTTTVGIEHDAWEDIDPATTNWTWTENQTLHAVWEKDRDLSLQITFDPNGGTVSPASYWIDYWYRASGTTGLSDNDYRTNRYGKMDQSVQGDQNQNYLSNNVSISRTGYTFDGWWYNGEHIQDDTPLRSAETHTLTAHWTPKTYKVTVALNGGTLNPACTSCVSNNQFQVVYDSPMNTNLSNGCDLSATRTGYTFGGWYMEQDCSGTVLDLGGTWMADYDATIYAKWVPNNYTVTLDANGGTIGNSGNGTATFTATYDSIYGDYLLSTNENYRPVLDGYIFRGWYLNGVEKRRDSVCRTAAAHTLVARWEKKIEPATITTTRVNCYGGLDGTITVGNISGGEGGSYTVVINKLNETDPVYTQTSTGTPTTVSFTGDADHPITAGTWTVAIYDNSHPENVYTDTTNGNLCHFFIDTVQVRTPDSLWFRAEPTEQKCSAQGKITVTVHGGTKPYTVKWTGASGIPTQSGQHTFNTDSYVISGGYTYFEPQDVTIHITDANGCDTVIGYENGHQVTRIVPDTTVTIDPATRVLTQIADETIQACGNRPFNLTSDMMSQASGDPIPGTTRYSWEAPATGTHSGYMESDFHDTISNTTGNTVEYVYEVTPWEGFNCPGNPFHVTVQVSPNSGGDQITVTLTDHQPGCANDPVTLQAKFTAAVHDVTYNYNGTTGNMTGNAAATIFTAGVSLPDTCSGDFQYSVTAIDGYGCPVPTKTGTLQVRIPDWSDQVPTSPTATEITCLRDTLTHQAPADIQIGCTGNPYTLTAERVGVTYSTDGGTTWTATPLTCDGLVRFTYRYTACDESSHDYLYTYSVSGNPNGPTVSNPVQDTAAVATGNCVFTYPDLRPVFRARMDAASTCTEREDVTVTQTPSAGSPITEANPKVTVTISDDCGKSSNFEVVINVPSSPVATAAADSLIACYGGTTSAAVTVTTGTGTAPFSYQWNSGSTSDTALNLKAGSYTVTVTDANGCPAYAFVNITEPSAIHFTLTTDNSEFCAGGSTVLYANNVYGGNGGYVYHWTKGGDANAIGSVPTTPIQTLTNSIIYTLYISDSKNCEADVQTLTVNVNPLPNVAVTPKTTTICAGGSVTLTVEVPENSDYRFIWDGVSSGDEYPVSTAGIHTVKAVDNVTQCSAMDTATVTVNDPKVLLNPITGDTTICYSNSTSLSVTTSNYTGTLTYQWFKDDVKMVGRVHDTLNNIATAGAYKVVATATVGEGASACPVTASEEVTVEVLHPEVNTPTVSGTTTICNGNITTLTASVGEGTVGAITYEWSPITGLNVHTGTEVVASPASTTTYSVVATAKVTATDNSGVVCSVESQPGSVTVTVNDPQVVLNEIATNATNNTICNGGSATLTASYDETGTNADDLTGGGKNVTYEWASSTAGEFTTVPTTAEITVTPSENTTYTVTATAHLGNCTSIAVKTISITVDNPTVKLTSIGDQTICAGATATFTAQTTGVNGTQSYKWMNAVGDSLTNTQGYQTSDALVGCDTTFTVVAYATMGACVKTDTTTATLHVLDPQVKLKDIDPVTICKGGNGTTLTAVLDGEPTGTVSYEWSNGTSGTDATSITENPTTTTDYTVVATATVTANGISCPKTDSKTVTVTVNDPQVSLNTMASKTVCYGGNTSLTVSTNNFNADDLSYEWKKGNNVLAGEESSTLTLNNMQESATYTVTVTATKGECPKTATATATVTVLHPTVETPTFEGATTICQGDNGTDLTVSAVHDANSTVTYHWEPASGLDHTDVATVHANPTENIEYTVVATATTTANGLPCTATAQGKVTVTVNNPRLMLNSVSLYNNSNNAEITNAAICKGMTVKLTANATPYAENTNT